jgi:hypothetical protein
VSVTSLNDKEKSHSREAEDRSSIIERIDDDPLTSDTT